MGECFGILGCYQTSRTNLKTKEGGFPASVLKVSYKGAIFVVFVCVAVIDICFKGNGEFNNNNLFNVVPNEGKVWFEVAWNNFNRDGNY